MSYEPNAPDEISRNRSGAERIGERSHEETGADPTGKSSSAAGSTADKSAQVRAGAAAGMDRAAGALNEGAEGLPGGRRVAAAAHTAADALESGADYLREHDLSDMMEDIMDVVKRNPGPALLGAAALGFLVGRAFTRD